MEVCAFYKNEYIVYFIQVREMNFYQEGDRTHYNQALPECTLQRCWKECINRSEFQRRKNDVDMFNR